MNFDVILLNTYKVYVLLEFAEEPRVLSVYMSRQAALKAKERRAKQTFNSLAIITKKLRGLQPLASFDL